MKTPSPIEFLPFLPVASIGDTRKLLQDAGVGGRNMVVDSWHFFYGPDDWPALEGLSAGEIAYVQFNDHLPLASDDLFHETTQKRVMPGAGSFDLKRFANTLRGLGYDGVVGPEILSAESRAQPLDAVAREIMATSRPYWI
jgi:sugar phosphate isomerase/epimerase